MSLALKPARARSRPGRPVLGLLSGQGRAHVEPLGGYATRPPQLRVIEGPTRILIVGPDADRRAAILDELARTLPESIGFEETDSVCEALELAPTSRMAIVTGDVGEVSAESLMHMLAQRHPTLPVMILDSPSRHVVTRVAARGSAMRV
jgi:DNA-binding NtrC family response regulator